MKKFFTLFLSLFFSMTSLLAQEDYDRVFFEKGKKLMTERKYREAAQEFDNALAIKTTTEYYYNKGLALRLVKDNKNAAEAFESGIALDAQHLPSYEGLIKAYKILRDDDKLIETWDKMAKNVSDVDKKLDAKFNIVKFLMTQGDYENAAVHAEEAVNISPQNVDALHLYAKVNNEMGNYEEAKTSAQKAADLLNTTDVTQVSKVFYELGFASHHIGDFATKEEAFAKVNEPSYKPKMNRLTPQYFTSLAKAFDKIFEYEEATKHLEEAIRIEEHFPQANRLKAVISGHRHPKLEMINFYKNAITGILKKKEGNNTKEFDQELLEDYEHLIELKINSREYGLAIESSEECLEIFAQQPLAINEIKFFKAIALYKEEKIEEAINILVELSSNHSQETLELSKYNFAIGNMYYKTQDYEKAKNFFKRSRGLFANASFYMFEKITKLDSPNNIIANSAAEEEEK